MSNLIEHVNPHHACAGGVPCDYILMQDIVVMYWTKKCYSGCGGSQLATICVTNQHYYILGNWLNMIKFNYGLHISTLEHQRCMLGYPGLEHYYLTRACAARVKQSVCPSVVNTKIARSTVLGVPASCK